jgi:hypothetical protein
MPDYLRAFQEGARIGEHVVSLHAIGLLDVTSGRVVACDPLVFADTGAFTCVLPKGRHSVVLSVARVSEEEERVAFAMLRASEAPVARWEPALLLGQDPSSLQPGEAFAYGVDAGLGCFMDVEAQALLLERMAALPDGENYFDDVLDAELQANAKPSWDWCLHRPNATDPRNVAIFSAGWGDGFYPTSIGLDVNGDVVCLVTDFDVIGWED